MNGKVEKGSAEVANKGRESERETGGEGRKKRWRKQGTVEE